MATVTVNSSQIAKSIRNLNLRDEINEDNNENILEDEYVCKFEYTDSFNQIADNNFNLKLFDSITKTVITFTGKDSLTGISDSAIQKFFLIDNGNADNTADNLNTKINGYPNFTSSINNKIITITHKTTNEITELNSIQGSSIPIGTNITDFTYNYDTGTGLVLNAAIPLNKIGTYQLIEKLIEYYNSIKLKVNENRNKISLNLTATINDDSEYSSSSLPNKANRKSISNNRGLVDSSVLVSVFSTTNNHYSEDAVFNFLKNISSEIFKLEQNTSLSNTISSTISDISVTSTYTDLLNNNLNTINNIINDDDVTINNDTKLNILIDETIKSLIKIRNSIKNTENNLINSLNSINYTSETGFNTDITTSSNLSRAINESSDSIIKQRGDLLAHQSGTSTTYKPAIFNGFSEDGLFTVLSILLYELIKFMNELENGNIGTSTSDEAGKQVINLLTSNITSITY